MIVLSCYIKEKWKNKLDQIKYTGNKNWIVSSTYSGSTELPEKECILLVLSAIFVVVWYRWPPVDRGWYSAHVLLWPPHTDSCRLLGKVIQMSFHTHSCYLFFWQPSYSDRVRQQFCPPRAPCQVLGLHRTTISKMGSSGSLGPGPQPWWRTQSPYPWQTDLALEDKNTISDKKVRIGT